MHPSFLKRNISTIKKIQKINKKSLKFHIKNKGISSISENMLKISFSTLENNVKSEI
jgi:hypothetical protein